MIFWMMFVSLFNVLKGTHFFLLPLNFKSGKKRGIPNKERQKEKKVETGKQSKKRTKGPKDFWQKLGKYTQL